MKFVAGCLCLDFVNTTGGWSGERVIDDKLETPADLERWAALAGIEIRRPFRPNAPEAARILMRARAFRGALHRILNCSIESRSAAKRDLRIVTAELAQAREHQVFATKNGRFFWKWDDEPALDAILWRVSQSAADILTSPQLSRVRRCKGENCGWMFLDTTRNHSRRWCDMNDCGTLAKVRRFRERQGR